MKKENDMKKIAKGLTIGLMVIGASVLSAEMQVFFYNELTYPITATLIYHDTKGAPNFGSCPKDYPVASINKVEIQPGEFVKAKGSYQNFCLKMSNWLGAEFFLVRRDHSVQLFHADKNNNLDRDHRWKEWPQNYGMNWGAHDAVKNPRGLIVKEPINIPVE